ncbi:MAG: PP2C family protein-serine/threonine phosphatase [Vicingaceae bacterium]
MTDEKTNRVKGRLKLSNLKLNTLLEITDAINSNSSKADLYAILKDVLISELYISKFALYIYDTDWHVTLTNGIDKATAAKINLDEVVNQYVNIDVLSSAQDKVLKNFDIVIPVYHKKKPLAYLLLADLDGEKIEISPIIKHLRFIQTLANIIVVALENKRLNKEYIKQVEVKKELELAQNMQSLLFPRRLPDSKNLKVEAYYQPHNEVGGDYYDVIQLDENRTALCVADVSGKGFSAALLMANFQANLRAIIKLEDNLVDLIKATNQKVIESANYEKFITLFICIFDAKEKELRYLNAGHQPGVLLKKDGTRELKKGCTVLGMFDELPSIQTESLSIEKGDKLICFTDGLTELELDGNQLGIEGIMPLIDRKNEISVIVNHIKEKVKSLKSASSIEDDITLLLAEFLP